ncbi:MAG: phosphoesterase [Gammaproteobacteria bacterium RIFCSPHIGHO2_12_FULL_45_9]|nr:MAG: phosphoesterase [Gammaproteobacteria bacterium RIFCSPHIGHO2_12_FULL_45_9]
MAINPDAHWRDSARPIKFFIWDGRAAFPVLIFILHMSLLTFIIAFGLIVFLSILNRYGFTPMVFFRWFRSLISGNRKLSIPWWMT